MSNFEDVSQRVSEFFEANTNALAITVSGSRTSSSFDQDSDVDFYVYSDDPIPIDVRRQVAETYGSSVEVGNQYWEDGDEWIDEKTKLKVDIMFRNYEWTHNELDKVINKHDAKLGYTTSIWHNISKSIIIYEKENSFTQLKQIASAKYADELQYAIIEKNGPVLRRNHSSYLNQVRKSVLRQDSVSIISRISAFQDSFFDVLFAINKKTHPGEKRLIDHSEELVNCPANIRVKMNKLFRDIGCNNHLLEINMNLLCDDLLILLQNEQIAFDKL